ncbi:MAG: hypothetical protein HFJ75_08790 [Eggerthellaceae bacterium]|nr:hypothetical protein [Eggerthellaceae bacterium]
MTARDQRAVEDSVFLAKRNLVDSIWKEARLEGIERPPAGGSRDDQGTGPGLLPRLVARRLSPGRRVEQLAA